jgi:hypothetical protein
MKRFLIFVSIMPVSFLHAMDKNPVTRSRSVEIEVPSLSPRNSLSDSMNSIKRRNSPNSTDPDYFNSVIDGHPHRKDPSQQEQTLSQILRDKEARSADK